MSLAPVSWAGAAFVLFVTLVIPWAVIKNHDSALAMVWIPLSRRFFAMLIPQVGLGLAAIATAWTDGVELFPARLPSSISWLAAAVFLIVALILVRPHWRRSMEEGKPTWRLFAPASPRERRMWIVLSLCAGIGEELVWRGVLPALLTRLSGSFAIALTLSVLSFAIAHAIQGLRSVLAIATFAVAFHALVWVSGSLYVGMAAHFVYDLIAGFTYAQFARELGLIEPLAERGVRL